MPATLRCINPLAKTTDICSRPCMGVVADARSIQIVLLPSPKHPPLWARFPPGAMGRAALRVFCNGLPLTTRIAGAGTRALDLALELCRRSLHNTAVVSRPAQTPAQLARYAATHR